MHFLSFHFCPPARIAFPIFKPLWCHQMTFMSFFQVTNNLRTQTVLNQMRASRLCHRGLGKTVTLNVTDDIRSGRSGLFQCFGFGTENAKGVTVTLKHDMSQNGKEKRMANQNVLSDYHRENY